MPIVFPEKKLVIATHNAGKVKEFVYLFKEVGLINHAELTLISASELQLPEPIEDGVSFAENAALKSRAAANASGLAALADDSGLCVDGLDGAPGIYSARWAQDKNFSPAFQRIERELNTRGIMPHGAKAAFICVLSLTLPNGETLLAEGKINGFLCFPPRGENGFGYDPIFIPEGETRCFAQMSAAEKNHYSHRARAVSELKKQL
ncbi:MAG: RdgB/HAM1 family non-canonical purine NTP pyrophosphatase [Alphaproteobacteria bacterium]|nr:RdgB/HAM1 family non-canonical purine NTP pyrophosphatase [Alphaproteobacteria bacterium]